MMACRKGVREGGRKFWHCREAIFYVTCCNVILLLDPFGGHFEIFFRTRGFQVNTILFISNNTCPADPKYEKPYSEDKETVLSSTPRVDALPSGCAQDFQKWMCVGLTGHEKAVFMERDCISALNTNICMQTEYSMCWQEG